MPDPTGWFRTPPTPSPQERVESAIEAAGGVEEAAKKATGIDPAAVQAGLIGALIEGLEARRKALAPAIQRYEEAATGLAQWQPPTLTPPPEPPSLAPRPWLTGEGPTSLGRVMAGLGLLSTMITGIGAGTPLAALRAFTGALEGWKAGDADAAARAWREYQAQLDHVKRRNEQALQIAEQAWRQHHGRLEAAKAAMTAALAEQGLHEYLATVQMLGADQALKRFEGFRDTILKLLQETSKLDLAHQRTLLDLVLKLLGIQSALRQEERAEEKAKRETWREVSEIQSELGAAMHAILSYNHQASRALDVMRAITFLQDRGMLKEAKGPWWGWLAELRRNFSSDPEVLWAVNTIMAWGTAMATGQIISEQEGKVGGLRFKSITEAEVAGLMDRGFDHLMSVIQRVKEGLAAAATVALHTYRTQADRLRAVAPWASPPPLPPLHPILRDMVRLEPR